jgi:hypothetical protein
MDNNHVLKICQDSWKMDNSSSTPRAQHVNHVLKVCQDSSIDHYTLGRLDPPIKKKIKHPPRRDGVEEKKEDDLELDLLPLSPRISQSQENEEEERKHGFQAQVENFAKIIFGSCGQAMEAASTFVEGKACIPRPWQPQGGNLSPRQPQPEALSIADELRKLAAQEGRRFELPIQPRAADIPKFLGEEAVQSFEDDNISAISQHTLEDMARNGIIHPVSQQYLRQQKLANHQGK